MRGHSTTKPPCTNKLSDENSHIQISEKFCRRKRAYVTLMLACNFLATLLARVPLVALACWWALLMVVMHVGMVTLVAVATLIASSCCTLVAVIAMVTLLNPCYVPLIQIRAVRLLKTAIPKKRRRKKITDQKRRNMALNTLSLR